MEVFSGICAFKQIYSSAIYTRQIVNEETLYIIASIHITLTKNAPYAMYAAILLSQPQFLLTITSNFIIYLKNMIGISKHIVYYIYARDGIHKRDNIQYISCTNFTDYGTVIDRRYNNIRYGIDFHYYDGDMPNDIEIYLDQYENIINYESFVSSLTFGDIIKIMLKVNFDYPESIKTYDFVNMSRINADRYYVKNE